jgi:hypothetical protein
VPQPGNAGTARRGARQRQDVGCGPGPQGPRCARRLRRLQPLTPSPAPDEGHWCRCAEQTGQRQECHFNFAAEGVFSILRRQQPWKQVSKGSGELDLRQAVREAVAKSRLADRELPANGRESPERNNRFG